METKIELRINFFKNGDVFLFFNKFKEKQERKKKANIIHVDCLSKFLNFSETSKMLCCKICLSAITK